MRSGKPCRLLEMLAPNYNTIGIRHLDAYSGKVKGEVYTYKAPASMAVKVGAHAIVKLPPGAISVVEIVRVDDVPISHKSNTLCCKWLVSLVDMEPYEHRLVKEAELLTIVANLQGENRQEEVRLSLLQNATPDEAAGLAEALKRFGDCL